MNNELEDEIGCMEITGKHLLMYLFLLISMYCMFRGAFATIGDVINLLK